MTRSLRTLITLASVVAVCALAPVGASALSITSITDGAYTNATDLTIEYSDPSAFTVTTCLLDSAAAICDPTQAVFTNISEGPHSFSIGGMGTSMMCMMWDPVLTGVCTMYMPMPLPVGPVTVNFTVDRTAPSVSFLSGPAEGSTVAGSTASFGIGASDGTVTCKLDGVAVACGGTADLSGLAPGGHQLVVTSTDLAGNTSAPAVRNFTVSAGTTTGIPTILKAPKSVKLGKKVKLTVECLAGCKISAFVKAGSKKVKLKPVSVQPGASSTTVTLSSKAKKVAKATLNKGKKVTLVLTPSGGGKSRSVRIK